MRLQLCGWRVFCLLFCMSLFVFPADAGAAETRIDVSHLVASSQIPQGPIPILDLGNVAITGSSDIWVGDSELGVGGDTTVNTGEFMDFTFAAPVYYFSITPLPFFNKKDRLIEA